MELLGLHTVHIIISRAAVSRKHLAPFFVSTKFVLISASFSCMDTFKCQQNLQFSVALLVVGFSLCERGYILGYLYLRIFRLIG